MSLYTNVSVVQAIEMVANKLYDDNFSQRPPVDKDTFTLSIKATIKNVWFFTLFGTYCQTDVAMGSSLGPSLANAFVAHCQTKLIELSMCYSRYIDDCLLLCKKDDAQPIMKQSVIFGYRFASE